MGGRIWGNTKPLVVFYNDAYLGNDEDFMRFMARNYKLGVGKNFERLGIENLVKMLRKSADRGVSSNLD